MAGKLPLKTASFAAESRRERRSLASFAPTKCKDRDSSVVVKTQFEFLARDPTERKVHIEAQMLVPVGSSMVRAIAVMD